MIRLRHWQGAAVVLACWGLLLPPHSVRADGTTVKSQVPQVKAADVALTPAGALQGSVFTPNGKPVDGATVALMQSNKVVAQTTTDKNGRFDVALVKPGAYEVVVANHGAPVRVWDAEAAPPSVRHQALFVVGKQVVRGQSCPQGCPDGYCECGNGSAFFGLDCITLIALGASATAAVLAGINTAKLDDIEEKVDKLLSP